MPYKLITPDDVKSATKGDFSDKFDSFIDDILIPQVGGLLADECNRDDFDLKERTEFFSPTENAHILFLRSPPVADSPLIQVWQSTSTPRVYDATTLLTNGNNYFVNKEQGTVELPSGCWARGHETVKVTYTGGYLTGNAAGVPEQLRGAAIYQVKQLFDRRDELGISSKSIEGGSVSLLPLILSPDVKKQLVRFRFAHAC